MDLISALQTFLRVAETGSFSAAAQERRRTQPAISRQISALERYLNTRLLHRTTSGIALTDEGQALIPLATRVVDKPRHSRLYWLSQKRAEMRACI